MAENYRHEDCVKLTDHFYEQVVSDSNIDGALQATLLGIIDTARGELLRHDYKNWAVFIRLGEAIWQRK